MLPPGPRPQCRDPHLHCGPPFSAPPSEEHVSSPFLAFTRTFNHQCFSTHLSWARGTRPGEAESWTPQHDPEAPLKRSQEHEPPGLSSSPARSQIRCWGPTLLSPQHTPPSGRLLGLWAAKAAVTASLRRWWLLRRLGTCRQGVWGCVSGRCPGPERDEDRANLWHPAPTRARPTRIRKLSHRVFISAQQGSPPGASRPPGHRQPALLSVSSGHRTLPYLFHS